MSHPVAPLPIVRRLLAVVAGVSSCAVCVHLHMLAQVRNGDTERRGALQRESPGCRTRHPRTRRTALKSRCEAGSPLFSELQANHAVVAGYLVADVPGVQQRSDILPLRRLWLWLWLRPRLCRDQRQFDAQRRGGAGRRTSEVPRMPARERSPRAAVHKAAGKEKKSAPPKWRRLVLL